MSGNLLPQAGCHVCGVYKGILVCRICGGLVCFSCHPFGSEICLLCIQARVRNPPPSAPTLPTRWERFKAVFR